MFTDLAKEDIVELEAQLDVPFVPTDEKIVEAMLDMGGVNENDLLYDLGSGDGRIVVAAAKDRGARAIGIDMDPQRIEEAVEYAEWTGVSDMVHFIEDDLLCADFSEATVVTLYLLHTVNVSLRPRILRELRPGTRIISHAFDMGGWAPDEQRAVGGTKIFKWIVPAQVEGNWSWVLEDGRRFQVELNQDFQKVSGKAWIDDRPAELRMALLRGSRLDLVIRKRGSSQAEAITLRFGHGSQEPVVAEAEESSTLLPVTRAEPVRGKPLSAKGAKGAKGANKGGKKRQKR